MQPQLVITTGTAGGIGAHCEVGDVVVSPYRAVRLLEVAENAAFHDAVFDRNGAPKTKYFAAAKTLFDANAGQLPKDNTRPPKILCSRRRFSLVRRDHRFLRLRHLG